MVNDKTGVFDAILAPGGGVRPGGVLPPWVLARCDLAVEYAKHARFIIALSAGTAHKPPPADAKGFPIFESAAAALYLAQQGIPPEKILTECSSYDTIGNAYFARVIHTEPRLLRRLLIITNAFHMPRTQRVFEWVFSLDFPGTRLHGGRAYQLEFLAAPDSGMDPALLNLRREKEQRSLNQLEKTIAAIQHNGKTFHQWLFSHHHAYAPLLAPAREEGAVRDSY